MGLGVERHNGKVPDEDEVKQWMMDFDLSNDGKVSTKEFLDGIKSWMKSPTSLKKKKPSPDMEESQSGRWDAEAQVSV